MFYQTDAKKWGKGGYHALAEHFLELLALSVNAICPDEHFVNVELFHLRLYLCHGAFE